MKRVLVSKEKPISFFTGVFPEYTLEGIAVDCGHIILIKKGSATLKINFQYVKQEKDNITILFPGDVVMVEEHSDDFELEYLVFSKDIIHEVFSQMGQISIDALKTIRGINSYSLSHNTNAIFTLLSSFFNIGKSKECHELTVLQLRSFYIMYQSCLINNGYNCDSYNNRKDELFFRFINLLSISFHEHRKVDFYANKLCITPKYLSNITTYKTDKNPKVLIDEYTIMHLRLLLKNTNKTISQISWEYNFSSVAFFCEYFKRHTGESPLSYRENISGV